MKIIKELNSSIVAGIISVLMFSFLISCCFAFFLFPTIIDIIILICFGHVFYKTLWKKEKLSRWEWVGFSILVILTLIFFVLGFIAGIMEAMI